MRNIIFVCIYLCLVVPVFSGTILGSYSDDYNDAMVLIGRSTRSFMHYKTFSTNKYTHDFSLKEDKYVTAIGDLVVSPLLPDLNFSYNYYDPNEGNDGGAWQGKGVNLWGNTGAAFKRRGFSAVLFPQFWFSENLSFPLMPASSAFDSEYAYFTSSIDFPQRLGGDPIFGFNWGESEIRYTLNRWTIGFGTQSIWAGPARINPVLFSNNAVGIPKLDIGLLPASTRFGDVEFRIWWGQLRESDYFDSDDSNNKRFINGVHLSFAPEILPGFTIGVHRVIIAYWDSVDYWNPLSIIDPVMHYEFGKDESDQRASISFDWLFPEVGFEVYGEWGRNDYSANWKYLLRAPEHSQAYTIGGRQFFFPCDDKNRFFVLEGELCNFIHSRDYEIDLGMSQTGFYTHGIVTQGHTNDGQLIGPEVGPGSDVQTVKLDYYWNKGKIAGFLQRINVNKDYIYGDLDREPGDISRLFIKFKVGIEWYYFLNSVAIGGKAYYLYNMNYDWIEDNDINSFYLGFSVEM